MIVQLPHTVGGWNRSTRSVPLHDFSSDNQQSTGYATEEGKVDGVSERL